MQNAKIADFREIDELVTKRKSNHRLHLITRVPGQNLLCQEIMTFFAQKPGNHDLFCK